MKRMKQTLVALCVLAAGACVVAQEAVIRKNIAERIPQLREIDEVNK